jgi:two-component system nitrate/nitrite response regulator NarL
MSALGRVLLVDAHARFRQAATAELRRRGVPCDALADPRAAAELLRRGAHDVLVVDVGSAPNRRLLLPHRRWPVVPVVVAVAGRPSVEGARVALRARAVDYLTKPVRLPALLESIGHAREKAKAVRGVERTERLIARCAEWFQLLDVILAAPGPAALPARLLTAVAREPPDGEPYRAPATALSPREQQVLLAFASGLRVRQIARTLGVSIHTARAHLKAIMRKLNVHSQAALVERLQVPWRGEPPSDPDPLSIR